MLPVGLDVAGRRCLVVGAGPVGARRAGALAAAGAEVVVVATEAGGPARELAGSGAVVLVERPVDPVADTAGAALVVCATGDAPVDDAVAAAARAAGALVNRADGGGPSDVSFPAVVAHGPLRAAVHGDPARPAPAVTAWAARRLDGRLGELLGLDAAACELLVAVVDEVRREVAAPRPDGAPSVTPTAADWRRGLDSTMLELISSGRRAVAKDHLLACLSSS